MSKNKLVFAFLLLAAGAALKYILTDHFLENENIIISLVTIVIIIVVGAAFVLKGAAKIIEETTEVLSERTKIASGLLQSLGTAFPDMALGVMAALVSLKLAAGDFAGSINYAIIAAAATFGSNIYNVGHAFWCIYRQNSANSQNKSILMFPYLKFSGHVTPISSHKVKPALKEFDTAIDITFALTVLTAIVASSMVIFGKIAQKPLSFTGDLYQLIKPVGFVILLISGYLLYFFRKSQRPTTISKPDHHVESLVVIWISLFVAGLAILMSAESMVKALEAFGRITGIPSVIIGVAAGLIGCLGEMLVIHNYTVNPKGRLGDAVVGVAMDNIVTTAGASIVALMGGIFLGGNALILIFVLILTLNASLIWQISKLKNYYLSAS